MGVQGVEKLFYFLDKCTSNLEYKEKNINVYLKGFLEANRDRYLKWLKDEWIISSKYKVLKNRLAEIVCIYEDKVVFNKECIEGKEFNEIIEIVNQSKEIIGALEKLENEEESIYVYLKESLEVNGDRYLKWLKDEWKISSKYKVLKNRLAEIVCIYEDKVVFNKECIEEKEFNKIIEIVNQSKEIIDILDELEKNNEMNINIIKSNSKQILNEDFVINKCSVIQNIKLLKKQIIKHIYENYSNEYIKKYFVNNNGEIKELAYEDLLRIRNEIIFSKVKGVKLVNPIDSDYIIAKQLCYNTEQNSYFTNIKPDEILKVRDYKIIELNNYNKYVKYAREVNLLDNSDKNISKIFSNLYFSGEKYMISTKAYFDALQKVKVKRGKKKCWICGNKLGLLNFDVTCKKHKEYENSEYL